ncbi:hypothetical protein [Palleronia rufa]
MAKVMGVSRSGVHAWQRRAPSTRSVADAAPSERLAEIPCTSKHLRRAEDLRRTGR